MRSRSFFTALLCCIFISQAGAQQLFRISQYTQHNFLYNPAAAGASQQPSIGAIYKKMWAGIDGGPQTSILFGDKYFAKKKTGLAVVLYDDKTGPTSRTGGELNLSYSVKLQEGKRLMFGLGGQFLQYKIDKDAIAKYIPNDPLLAGPSSKFTGDAAAGVYLNTPTLNIGISVKQLIQSKLDFIKSSTNIEGRLYRHYYLMASYNLKTDEDNTIIPNALLKYQPNAPVDFEAGALLDHKDVISIGFNYHYKQSFSAFAALKIDHKLSIGYAYDQYSTPLSTFDNGGDCHEISLRYFFKK